MWEAQFHNPTVRGWLEYVRIPNFMDSDVLGMVYGIGFTTSYAILPYLN